MNLINPQRQLESQDNKEGNNPFKSHKLKILTSRPNPSSSSSLKLVQNKRSRSFNNSRKNSKFNEGSRRPKQLQSRTRKIPPPKNLT